MKYLFGLGFKTNIDCIDSNKRYLFRQSILITKVMIPVFVRGFIRNYPNGKLLHDSNTSDTDRDNDLWFT